MVTSTAWVLQAVHAQGNISKKLRGPVATVLRSPNVNERSFFQVIARIFVGNPACSLSSLYAACLQVCRVEVEASHVAQLGAGIALAGGVREEEHVKIRTPPSLNALSAGNAG